MLRTSPKSATTAAFRCVGLASILLFGCGEADERPAEWSLIAPVILAPNCATSSCHSEAVAKSGLDLSDADRGYRSLLLQKGQFFVPGTSATSDPACKAAPGGLICLTPRPLVQPCNPDQSHLINMLRGRGASRMPPDRPLPLADIELIERWILAGAKESPGAPFPTCGVPDAGAPMDAQGPDGDGPPPVDAAPDVGDAQTPDRPDAPMSDGPDARAPDAGVPDGAAG